MKSNTTNSKKIEIDGILVPYSWSTHNRVTTVSIQSAGEMEYLIDSKNKNGKELKKLLGKRVLLKGQLSPIKTAPRNLLVISYKIIDW